MSNAVAASRAEGVELPPGQYFTIREIMDLTKLSYSKLHTDAIAGILKCLRRGRSLRVSRRALLDYLAGE